MLPMLKQIGKGHRFLLIVGDVDGEKSRREADLPGALPKSACPDGREKAREDRPLGCAMALLNAGSTQKFLALIKSRPQI